MSGRTPQRWTKSLNSTLVRHSERARWLGDTVEMEGIGFLFQAADYGPEVSAILALDGDGERLMPLVMETRARNLQRVEWQLLFDYCARSSA